jgi:hypothetical protein
MDKHVDFKEDVCMNLRKKDEKENQILHRKCQTKSYQARRNGSNGLVFWLDGSGLI